MRLQLRYVIPVAPRAVRLICTIVLALSWSCQVVAQQNAGSAVGGFAAPRTIIPEMSSRPLTAPGESFNVTPSSGSVASFIDSISKNDAAFSVVVGQGRILTLKDKVADETGKSVVAIGDPTIADFQPLPNPRLFRVLGLRPGVTDFSVTTENDETVSLEIHVTYDLQLLEAKLRQLFPSAHLRLAQLREHLVVGGQARSVSQASRIVETLTAYLESMQIQNNQRARNNDIFDPSGDVEGTENGDEPPVPQRSNVELGGVDTSQSQGRSIGAKVINLMQVPGVQQVLLKVKIAELNRTAIREIGADILGVDPSNGNLVGTQIGGAAVSAAGAAGLEGLLGSAGGDLGPSNTAFGIFPTGDWQIIFRALRRNGLVRVLAEPNLIAMSGHRANFLAGGEFPVPVPQSNGGGAANSVTVDFREFGVRLDFLPFVVDEGRVRLSVTPEVSTIDFTLGTTLVANGDPVPGLNTRRANTTVEMQPGQTLAMAGLLQVELNGQTNRIPGLGDLPYIGPFFSNTTHRRVEKELLVLVTPHLVKPLEPGHMMPLPGDEVEDPTDEELYFGNQYEGATGVQHRSTIEFWPRESRSLMRNEKRLISGPVGFGN